jgi:hypothetical protein
LAGSGNKKPPLHVNIVYGRGTALKSNVPSDGSLSLKTTPCRDGKGLTCGHGKPIIGIMTKPGGRIEARRHN